MKRRKKLLYLTFNNPLNNIGVYKKESDFCCALGNVCAEKGIIFKGINIIDNPQDELPGFVNSAEYFDIQEAKGLCYRFFSKIKFIRFYFWSKMVIQHAYEQIKCFTPDVIIFRYNAMPVLFSPKKINNEILFLSEYQTKLDEELILSHSGRIMLIIENANFNKFSSDLDAVIGVTPEIAHSIVHKITRTVPYFILSNGIDVKRYPIAKYLPFSGDTLKCIVVTGKIRPWLGLDRLLKGMADFRGKVKIELNIVGPVSKEFKDLVKAMNLENEVFFHGEKSGKKLDDLFNDVHICFGSLGVHRKKLTSACGLKEREYMTRGLPFVISHHDEDIEDNSPFVLKIPADESPVDIEKVLAFTRNVYKECGKEIRHIMHKYASENMDYTVKVKGLLDFIINLLNTRKK